MRRKFLLPLVPFLLLTLFTPLFAGNYPILMCFEGVWYSPLLHYWLSPKAFPRSIDLFWNVGALLLLYWLVSAWLQRGFGMKRVLQKLVQLLCTLSFFLFSVWSSTSTPPVVLYGDDALHLTQEQQGVLVARKLRDQTYDRELSVYLHSPELLNTISTPYSRRMAAEVQKNEGYSSEKQDQVDLLGRMGLVVWPLISSFNWEEDIGGSVAVNKLLPFHLKTRHNRHSLASSLLYALRTSLFVGIFSVLLSLLFATPVGIAAGYWGGRLDLLLCRVVEVWESLPQFLTLLLLVAFLESTSLFLICGILAVFGWTMIFRYFRTETYRERQKAYIECVELYHVPKWRVIFVHLLPNCLTPVVALIPFEVMAVITRESSLSFLGLGDPQSCSLGVLMDEGRLAFMQEPYLLWAPALVLGGLIFAIALVGDQVRKSYSKQGVG